MRDILRKVWSLLDGRQRRAAIRLLGLMFLGMVLETLGIGLIVPVFALLTEPDFASRVPALKPMLSALGNPTHTTVVVGAMLFLAAAFIVKNAYLALVTWKQMRFAFGLQACLSRRLFSTYLSQPYAFHLHANSAELLRNTTTDVNLFATHAMIPGMLLLSEALVLAGLFTLLMVVEPLGALIVICVLGVAAWVFHRATRARLTRWGLERQRHEGLRIQHLQEGLGGVKEVKLLGREANFLAQYDRHNAMSARMSQLQSTLYHLPRLWLEVLAVIGLAGLVLVMVALERPLSSVLPTLALFAAAAFRLMPSANRAIAGLQSLRYGLPVIDMLYAQLKLDDRQSSERAAGILPFTRSVELDDVSFTYPHTERPTLSHLSVTIRRGETVGFIGSSGAGKSTLVDVLLGLLEVDSGAVRVDSVDIRTNLRGWQDQIGYVSQTIYLTDDTLRRNVAFGLPDEAIEDERVWQALRAAQLDDFVRAAPQGLDTVVGERGVRLSGGQRQRIGVARALYRDPPMLVLDEATSSLDTETEQGVMQAVRALHGSKTIVIVAHRLSTVEHCDRLYRLEAGRVVEEGVPGQVLGQRRAGFVKARE